MAYNAWPMVSPKTFEELLSPRYRRITETLHAGGVDTIIVDSDGKIDDLVPLWLEAGVNTLMPIEIGTTGMDPDALRKQFGTGLKMVGRFDKRILWKSRETIAAEVDRLTPVVHQGGFIPCCDHKVTPEVRLDDYMYFLTVARQRWCSDTRCDVMSNRLKCGEARICQKTIKHAAPSGCSSRMAGADERGAGSVRPRPARRRTMNRECAHVHQTRQNCAPK